MGWPGWGPEVLASHLPQPMMGLAWELALCSEGVPGPGVTKAST